MMHTIYKNLEEWYSPDIDYRELMNNFQWTQNPVSDLMQYNFPLQHVMLRDHAGAFNPIRKRQQMFQFFNKQFNDRLEEILATVHPRLILDPCAGDGMLAKILTDRGFSVKAVDNFEWPFEKKYFDVEELDYKKALEKYQPDVVIGCWMPLGTNWTPDFRTTPSVKQYLIIGEGEDGCCGGDWKPVKGWTKKYQEKISRYGVCRTDDLWFHKGKVKKYSNFHTRVYTFSRR